MILRCFLLSLPGSDGGQPVGDNPHHQPPLKLQSPGPCPPLGESSFPSDPGMLCWSAFKATKRTFNRYGVVRLECTVQRSKTNNKVQNEARCTHLNVKDLHYHTDPNDAVEEGGVYMNPPGGKHLVDTTLDALRKLGRDLQAIRRQVDRQQRGNHNSEEWIQVAGVIDRFLFWLYAVFIIVSFVVMICIWASSYSK